MCKSAPTSITIDDSQACAFLCSSRKTQIPHTPAPRHPEHASLPRHDSKWRIPYPAPIETSKIEADGGRWLQLKDGRIVEYFVSGSCQDDATVLVDIHAGNCSGKFFSIFPEWVAKCEELNLRVISPSLPGFGYSTINPGRAIRDWPETDLLPVLEKEAVNEFVVSGASFGTPHALATAWFFGEGKAGIFCKGMGLRVPYLSSEVCTKLGLKPHINLGYTAKTANTTMIGHYTAKAVTSMQAKPSDAFKRPGFLMRMFIEALNPGALARIEILKAEHGDTMLKVMEGMDRCVVHTDQGILYSYATETLLDHAFNVEEIRQDLPSVVWYAEDDEDCPAAHGKWLAGHFEKCSVRAFSGYGHVGAAFLDQPQFLEALMSSIECCRRV